MLSSMSLAPLSSPLATADVNGSSELPESTEPPPSQQLRPFRVIAVDPEDDAAWEDAVVVAVSPHHAKDLVRARLAAARRDHWSLRWVGDVAPAAAG